MRARLPFVFIIITVTLNSIGIGLIFPVMPKLMQDLGQTSISDAAAWGGALSLVFALMQFLFGPLLGNLSDRFGRRPVLMVSLVATGIDYLIMAAAQTLWLLFIVRAVSGITAATFAVSNAFIADLSPPENRAANFGLTGAAFGIGFVLGPVLGGVLGEFGPRAPFIAAAILAFANALFGFLVLPESLAPENRRRIDLRQANPLAVFKKLKARPELSGLIGVNFVDALAGNVYPAVWAYFAIERFGWSTAMVGASLAAYGACFVAIQGGLLRPILAKLGEWRTAFLGLSLAIVGFSVLAMLTSGAIGFLLTPLFALRGISNPAMVGILSGRVGAEAQGELQGILAAMTGLATLVSIPLMTQIFSAATQPEGTIYFPGAPFVAAAVLSIAAFLLLLRVHRMEKSLL